ncbi:hypothetical protein [Serratia fonticola]|uniref:hypothetical protein n=1 Tax=Serratia fonticola TaxID=47917 RepID=UPI0013789AD6|nr:hypothetical protein [Serratia fonticola]NCG50561.1 hypothetical protein [Serratia fonticola]
MLKIINSPWSVLVLVALSMGLCASLDELAFVLWGWVFGGAVIWVLGCVQNLGYYLFSLFLAFVVGGVGGLLVALGTASAFVYFGWVGFLLSLLSAITAFLTLYQLKHRGALIWIR